MLDLTQDIQSLTTFRRRSSDFLKQLKKSKRPVILTVKGKAAAIVQDAAAYQRLLDIAAAADPREGIRQGLEQSRKGQGQSAHEFFKEFDAEAALDGRMQRPVDLDEETRAMALRSYGYGRWDAPYWFIGPEQGTGEHERKDLERALKLRVAAWVKLGRLELNDCRMFHCEIGERNWHCKDPVKLQRTWGPLLLLLMNFLEAPAEIENLRAYQRGHWGMLDGKTCVIELSGLAAPKLKKAKANLFLNERIQVICEKIRMHRPEFVLMYGRMQRKSWNAIAKALTGNAFPDATEADLPKTSILVDGRTTLCCTPHPSRPIQHGARYLVNEYWARLGQKLRGHRGKSV